MNPANQLFMKYMKKNVVQDIPRGCFKTGLITRGTGSLILVSSRGLPEYLAQPQAHRIRRALQNLCCDDVTYESYKFKQEVSSRVVGQFTLKCHDLGSDNASGLLHFNC